MAIIEDASTGDLLKVDATARAARVAIRPVEGEHYRLAASTGLITTVAAGTASAGHVFAFRWGSAAKVALVHRIYVKWRTVAGFTAAQEVGLDVMRATGYSASHSGGTAIVLNAPNLKKRQSYGASLLTDARISGTGALTAGTHTLDGQHMGADCFAELAAAATVPKGAFDVDIPFAGCPLQLATNEGFVVRNTVLMGAGGTARVTVEVDWSEVITGASW